MDPGPLLEGARRQCVEGGVVALRFEPESGQAARDSLPRDEVIGDVARKRKLERRRSGPFRVRCRESELDNDRLTHEGPRVAGESRVEGERVDTFTFYSTLAGNA